MYIWILGKLACGEGAGVVVSDGGVVAWRWDGEHSTCGKVETPQRRMPAWQMERDESMRARDGEVWHGDNF